MNTIMYATPHYLAATAAHSASVLRRLRTMTVVCHTTGWNTIAHQARFGQGLLRAPLHVTTLQLWTVFIKNADKTDEFLFRLSQLLNFDI